MTILDHVVEYPIARAYLDNLCILAVLDDWHAIATKVTVQKIQVTTKSNIYLQYRKTEPTLTVLGWPNRVIHAEY